MSAAVQQVGAYTWEEFVALDEDDLRELVDGVLVETEVPDKLHEWIVGVVYFYLLSWTQRLRAGLVLPSGFKVRITERRGFMPDVQYYKAGREVPRAALERGAPDLVVEVMSPGSRRYDRAKKLLGYASIGTPEYWLIDPVEQTIERLVLDNGRYVITEVVEGDEVFAPASFPGLQIPLVGLWTPPDEGGPGPIVQGHE
jgi:Uma2 family endonuclease